MDRERGFGREAQPGPVPLSTHLSTVCYLQTVPPGGAGAARPLAGYPAGLSEPLLRPGSAAGEYLEENRDQEDEKGSHPGILAPEKEGCLTAFCLTLLLSPDKVPEPAPWRTLPLPRPPSGPGRHFSRVGSHLGRAAAGCCQLCHHHLAAGELHLEREGVRVRMGHTSLPGHPGGLYMGSPPSFPSG